MADSGPSSSQAKAKFTRNDFMLAPQKYQRLLYLLASDPVYDDLCDSVNANALAEAMGMGVDLDMYAKLLSNFFNLWDRNLMLINWCIQAEFKTSPAAQSGSLMRGNTFLSKLESEFARKHGTEYLRLLFTDLVREVITQDQSFDIDTSRGNISESILQDRIIKLKLLAQRFFARITSEDMRKKMPRVIRAIAGLTRTHAKTHFPNSPTSPLIGGFLMLRYFAPALVSPEAFGLLGPDEVPSPKARANLIIIAKVLQNISNGLTFETTKKEEHMKPLDDFVRSQFKLMDLYYQSVAEDPLIPSNSISGVESWADLLNKPLTLEMIQIDKIGLPELFQLHRLIYRFKNKFLTVLASKQSSPGSATLSTASSQSPAISTPVSLSTATSASSSPVPSLQNTEITQLLQLLGPPPSVQGSGPRSQPTGSPSTGALDWIYMGRPNKAGHSVFYIIVCKVDLSRDLEGLVQQALQFFYTSVGANSSSPISLVVDMSWSNVSEVKRKFFTSNRFMTTMQEIIPHEMKKRIREIHLVHPSGVNHMMMFLFRTFVSKKFFSKLHEHSKWKTLTNWIDPSKIDLPEESKSYITKAYRVTKVNAKGKRQSRIVKFTDNSILNIDPSSGTLKNEKLLDDIEDISLTTEGDATTIVMNFSAGSAEREAGRRKKSLFGQLGMKDKADLTTRTYVCASKSDAERFMEDVFEAAYRAQKLQEPLEYKVIKVNEVGKHQERTFKLTCDSLLNLDGTKIRTEISFVGIKQVDCDKNDVKVLWIQLKNEFGPRKIIFEDAAQRNAMFLMLTARVFQANGLEDDEAAQMKFETALWRIKDASTVPNGTPSPSLTSSNPGIVRSSSGITVTSAAATSSSPSSTSPVAANGGLHTGSNASFSSSSTATNSYHTGGGSMSSNSSSSGSGSTLPAMQIASSAPGSSQLPAHPKSPAPSAPASRWAPATSSSFSQGSSSSSATPTTTPTRSWTGVTTPSVQAAAKTSTPPLPTTSTSGDDATRTTVEH